LLLLDINTKSQLLYITHLIREMMTMMLMMMMMMITSAYKENNSHGDTKLLAEMHPHVPFLATNHTCPGLHVSVLKCAGQKQQRSNKEWKLSSN
jgi:hypothetical protein